MRKGFFVPRPRVYLDTVDPQIPMHVRPGDAPGVADLSDQFASSNMVTNFDIYFSLVVQPAVDSLSVINNGGIAAHGLQPGKNNHTIGWCVHIERVSLGTDTKVNPGME